MATYRTTIPSNRTSDETFAYMADFGNLSDWDPATTTSTRVGEGPLRLHEHFDVEMKIAGRSVTLDYELVELDPATRSAVLRGTNDSAVSYDRITVADDATVTYDAEVKLSGPMRLLDPLFGVVFRRMGDNAARQLARNLGGPPR